MPVKILILFLMLILPPVTRGQNFFRIKADFSLKEVDAQGKSILTIGTVYYDLTERKLVYETTFPEKETWIATDTVLYRMVNGKLKEKEVGPYSPEASLYSVFLNGKLSDYGFKNSNFTLQKAEKEDSLVISTWIPPKKLSNVLGKVLLSQKNQRLEGIIFISKSGKVALKQLFRKYQVFSGLEFPTEVIQMTNDRTGETNQLIQYKNVVVNDFKDKTHYNPVLPD